MATSQTCAVLSSLGDDELAVRAETASDAAGVARERAQAAAACDVPDLRRPVVAGGDDELAVRS